MIGQNAAFSGHPPLAARLLASRPARSESFNLRRTWCAILGLNQSPMSLMVCLLLCGAARGSRARMTWKTRMVRGGITSAMTSSSGAFGSSDGPIPHRQICRGESVLSGAAATQILSATHGFVLLAMSGFIDSQGLQDVMAPLAINLIVGLGDTRRRAGRSLAAAIEARASQR